MICPNCGNEIQENKKFCKNCGYKIPTQSEIILNKLKENWKKILITSLSIVLVCIIGWQVLCSIMCKIQFDNAINSSYTGHIIVVQSPKDKSFSNIEQGIKAKLKDAYGNNVRIEAYCGNKAVIYADNSISPDNIISYLSKPMLVFKKQGNTEDKWVDTGITDKHIKKSEITTMSDGAWAVGLEFTNEGKEKFAELTKAIVGQQLAIFFNNEFMSAPKIMEPILEGKAQISGGGEGFTYEEAKRMSEIVQAGVDLEIVEVKQ